MTHALQGQNAFITGGGSGIGLACAIAFVRDGAHVTLFGRSRERLEKGAADVRAEAGSGAQVRVVSGDVAVEQDVMHAVAAAGEAGPVTIAVANAGTGGVGPIIATDDAEWNKILKTNLSGTFYTFKHAGRAIVKAGGGAICVISSIAGARTHRFMGPYCASKAAIDSLVRNTADELGVAGVRVNSVLPGLVDTDLVAGLLNAEVIVNDYLDCMPIRRTGKVEDIARAVRFLCGPESSWITGVNLSVDGGHHLRRGPDVSAFSRILYGNALTDGRIED